MLIVGLCNAGIAHVLVESDDVEFGDTSVGAAAVTDSRDEACASLHRDLPSQVESVRRRRHIDGWRRFGQEEGGDGWCEGSVPEDVVILAH